MMGVAVMTMSAAAEEEAEAELVSLHGSLVLGGLSDDHDGQSFSWSVFVVVRLSP